MKMRRKTNKKSDAKMFKNTAIRTNIINTQKNNVPRGGIRL